MFTATPHRGAAQAPVLPGLNTLAPLGMLSALPGIASARFGRVLRSYPAHALVPPMAPVRVAAPAQAVAQHQGIGAALARRLAAVLARLAEASERRAQRWQRERERRRTERALHALDRRALGDIGLTRSEISSAAMEVAEEIEATRARIGRDISQRIR